MLKQRVKDLDESWRASRKPDILHSLRSKGEQKSKVNPPPISEADENAISAMLEEIKKLRIVLNRLPLCRT